MIIQDYKNTKRLKIYRNIQQTAATKGKAEIQNGDAQ